MTMFDEFTSIMHSSSTLYMLNRQQRLARKIPWIHTSEVSRLRSLTLPERQESSYIRHVLHTLEQRDQM